MRVDHLALGMHSCSPFPRMLHQKCHSMPLHTSTMDKHQSLVVMVDDKKLGRTLNWINWWMQAIQLTTKMLGLEKGTSLLSQCAKMSHFIFYQLYSTNKQLSAANLKLFFLLLIISTVLFLWSLLQQQKMISLFISHWNLSCDLGLFCPFIQAFNACHCVSPASYLPNTQKVGFFFSVKGTGGSRQWMSEQKNMESDPQDFYCFGGTRTIPHCLPE